MSKIILCLIGLIFSLQNFCFKESRLISQKNSSKIAVGNQNSNSKVNQVESNTNLYRKDSDKSVYVSILRQIVYRHNSDKNWGGNSLDEFSIAILFVKSETISPPDSTILETVPDVLDETIKDFRKTNETASFAGGLSIKYDARRIEGGRDLEKLFAKAEKKPSKI